MDTQTIERTALSNLIYNEDYTRKVLPFIKGNYFDLKEENKFIDRIIGKFYKRMGMQNENEFQNYLLKNNVLVLEFDKYGILQRKEFYDKKEMNEIKFAKNETVNELRKENFIYSFLSSVRQKMMTKTK